MMNFRADDDFRAVSGIKDGRLSIYYNFAAFDWARGCSEIYDPDSPYYSSFYGAYIVRGEGGKPYGFTDDDAGKGGGALTPDLEQVAGIARLDFSRLVLLDFGLQLSDQIFSYESTGVESGVTFLDSDGWTRIDAVMYNNHGVFGKLGANFQINGALVCRDEGLTANGGSFNWDMRLRRKKDSKVVDKMGLPPGPGDSYTVSWMEVSDEANIVSTNLAGVVGD